MFSSPYRIILKETFKTEWLDQEKEKIPWHESYFKEQKYDIFNLHTGSKIQTTEFQIS